MEDNLIKAQTGNFIFGVWQCEGIIDSYQTRIIVSISQREFIINWHIAGVFRNGITLSPSAHWFGDFLCFTDESKYFIKYADEQKMIFGEFSQPASWSLGFFSRNFN